MVIKMHRIDLEKYNINCDLIGDINNNSIKVSKTDYKGIKIEKVIVNKTLSKKINKKEGQYISIIFDDNTDKEVSSIIKEALIKELTKILKEKKLLGKASLVVGLGNNMSTPDSLGPKTIDKVIVTRHLQKIQNLDSNYSCVSKIAPGVFSTTGIESYDIIKSISNMIKPNFIIIIDALCSTSINKVNKVIQITDSGITPGSGVENHRKEISKKSLGIDIITIGIPTVVNLHTIVKEFLDEYDVDDILKKKGNNYMVTPKNIDFEIEQLSYILSNAINNTLHK